jgi:uncharacterized membrane protein YhdT
MKPKRWIFLSLFLAALLLSAWLSPSISLSRSRAAYGLPETVLLSTIENAIALPLWEEDSLIYLPIIR